MIGWKPGEKIVEDGIYPSIPLAGPGGYHGDLCAGHSVSHTGLDRLFKKSAAHYWVKCYANPERVPDEPTEAMILGRALHFLVMGERGFQKHFIRRPERLYGTAWNGNRTDCKDWLAEQARKGLTVLKGEQVDKITGIGRSLEREPMVKAGLFGGKPEQSFIVRDPETGIYLKARPDIVVPNDMGDFVDLKSVSDISDDSLEASIGSFGWHRQGSLVCELAARLMNKPLKFRAPGEGDGFSHTLVFVETEAPYCVEIVTLRVSDLERGVIENRAAIRLLARCLETNTWPGPSGHQSDARYLGLKPWATERNAFRVSRIETMLRIGKPQITEQA